MVEIYGTELFEVYLYHISCEILKSMIRTFVALEVAPAIQHQLKQVQQLLTNRFHAAGLQEAVRPVATKQLHITLRFLGDIEESFLDPIAASLQQVGIDWRRTKAPIQLSVEPLGGFPNLKRPSVLWCGVGDTSDGLLDLQEAVTQTVEPWCEKSDDKPFHPHLTLFRIKTPDQTKLRRIGEIVRETQIATGATWTATGMKFFRSELTPSGPKYSVIASVPLND